MPIYEYKCDKCGADFEALVRNSESRPECPECQSKTVTRRMSAPSTHASGSSSETPCGADCGGHAHSCGCHGACCCH